MIVTLPPQPLSLYRANTPKFSSTPLSGKGAAIAGGRFNRPGMEALYLSLEPATAVAEYQQDSILPPPLTLCAYEAHLPRLVDLRQLDGSWDALWNDWNDDWRELWFGQHIEPASWVLSDLVRAAGRPGIFFPSLRAPGGTNVVLYPDLLIGHGTIAVHDPGHSLPKDQSSWAP